MVIDVSRCKEGGIMYGIIAHLLGDAEGTVLTPLWRQGCRQHAVSDAVEGEIVID